MKLITNLIVFILIVSFGILLGPDLYAQDQKEDVIYLINGGIIRGKILDIKKDTISIRQKDGYFFKYNVNEILRFVSDRSVSEIYKESAEGPKDDQKAKRIGQTRTGIGLTLSYANINDDNITIFGIPVDLEADDAVAVSINFTAYLNYNFSLEFAAEHLKTDIEGSSMGLQLDGDLTQYAFLLTGRFHVPLYDNKIFPYWD